MESKRELIKKINNDNSLSQTEKSLKIQELMMGQYKIEIEKTINESKTLSNESKTCIHYQKSSYKFYFDCCKIYDPCKRCHMERNCSNYENLVVDTISCSICETSQKPNDTCIGCNIKFSNSYCGICYIWTEKDIFHCVKCGICRIGLSDNYIHSDYVGYCVSKDSPYAYMKATKQCDKNNICGICRESTFNSQKTTHILNCGHHLHTECYNQYLSSNRYNCIQCKKSIVDMSEYWKHLKELINSQPIQNNCIPVRPGNIIGSIYGKFLVNSIYPIENSETILYSGELIDWTKTKSKVYATLNSNTILDNVHYKNIHCNDCEKKSMTKFHFLGLECMCCHSFNTQE